MRRWLIGAWLAILAADGRAHAFSPDADHFYSGLSHAFIDPAQLLLLLALGLLAAQRDLGAARAIVMGVPLGALTVSLLPGDPAMLGVMEAVVLGAAGTAGALVAWGRPLPRAWLQGLAVAAALGLGTVNGAELAREAWLAPHLYLSGAALGILMVLVAAFVAASRLLEFAREWTSIAVRVAGSWLLASSLLLLALAAA